MRNGLWASPILVLLLLLAGCNGPADPVDAALDYLANQDLPSTRALQALEATAGLVNPVQWPPGDPLLGRLDSPVRYPDIIRLVHGLALHGLDPRDWQGTDWVNALWMGHDGAQFGDPASIADDALAVRALAVAGIQDIRLTKAVQDLRSAQAPDGSWSWRGGGAPGGPDVTAWVLEALNHAGGLDVQTRGKALAYFDSVQVPGGYGGVDGRINCQTTGLVLHALHTVSEPAPQDAVHGLFGCQRPGGGFSHMAGDRESNLWATLDVLPALAVHA